MLQVRIDKLVYGGDGLGRLDGRTVLLPLVLPGELVAAHPVKEEPRLIRARLAEIIEAAPERISALCPYFARCGGCHYQHTTYDEQIRHKSAILRETLRRLGKIDSPEPKIIAGEPWNYRNRTQFKFEKRGPDFALGYFEMGSHRLLPVALCPISSPRINQVIPELWALGRRPDFAAGTGEIEIVTAHDDSPVLLNVTAERPWPETLISAARERIADLASLAVAAGRDTPPRVYGKGHIVYRAAGSDYRLSHGAFFQTNRFLTDRLAETAIATLRGGLALDLFCGVGYFTLPLARAYERVVAVESHPSAARDLKSNRNRAALNNVDVHHAPAAEFLARWKPQSRRTPDAVLLDPPRTGLGRAAAEHLAAIGAANIVYVSCDPATLARDLAVLLQRGYSLAALTLVDLFPQTFHIETVATLTK